MRHDLRKVSILSYAGDDTSINLDIVTRIAKETRINSLTSAENSRKQTV
jgi:hypothetical protein